MESYYNQARIERYSTLLERFFEKVTQSDLIGANYPHGIFIPHPLNDEAYSKSPTKIFYIGKDTRYWMGWDQNRCPDEMQLCGVSSTSKEYFFREKPNGFNFMQYCYAQRCLYDYIQANKTWPYRISRIKSWGKVHTFWPFVINLHLRLMTGKLPEDISSLTDSQNDYLNGIGYGNIFSIERKESLRKEEAWGNIDYKKLSEMQSACADLDKIQNIIDLYAPDYIIILCWQWDPDQYLGKDNYFQKDIVNENSKLCTYRLNDYPDTKIICTYHPQALRSNKIYYGMVEEIAKLLQK